MKWIPRSKSGASKSRPRWAAHTRIGNVWEYPPRAWSLRDNRLKGKGQEFGREGEGTTVFPYPFERVPRRPHAGY